LNQFERLLGQEPVKACFLIPNFNNPLGYRQSEEDKKEIVRITAEKGIPIVEDDVYADLYFEGERPRPLKAYDTQGLVLLCSSPSKSLCPGYRVGWVAPGRYKDTIKRLKYMGNISAPTLSQLAMAEFMRSGFYDRHLRKLRLLLKNQIHFYTEAIRQHFPSETRITRPQGGFLLWLELPATVDAFQLYALALEKGMSIAPGPMFSAVQGYRNYIRLSCGLPWSTQIEQAIKIMGSLAKDLIKRAK
jgi:DNA-binding transcriptional MocR family regulator